MIQDRQGRLIAACWKFAPFGDIALISEDHGKTWQRSAPVPGPGDECQVVELSDGRLLMEIRQEAGDRRSFSVSRDGGRTWSAQTPGLAVTPVACGVERLVPRNPGTSRDRIAWTGSPGPGREGRAA